jgi:hypothetical protein
MRIPPTLLDHLALRLEHVERHLRRLSWLPHSLSSVSDWLLTSPHCLEYVLNLSVENFGLINQGLIHQAPVLPGGQQWPNGPIQNLGGYHNGSQQQVPQVPQRGMSNKHCIFHEVVANACVDVQANFGVYNQPPAYAPPVQQANSGSYNNPIVFNLPAPQAAAGGYNQPFVPAMPVQQGNSGAYNQPIAYPQPAPQANSGDYNNPILLNSPAPQAAVEGYNQPLIPAPPVQQGNSGGYNHPVGWASPSQQASPAADGAGHVPSALAAGVAAEPPIDLTGESLVETPNAAPPETPRVKADSSFWKKGAAHLLTNCLNTYSRSDPWYLLESMRSYPHGQKRAQYCECHWPNEKAAEHDIAEKSSWFLDAEELFIYDLKWKRLLALAENMEPSEAEALDQEIFAEQAMLAKQLKGKREAKRAAEDLAQKKDCLDKMSPQDFKRWYKMPKNLGNIAKVMEEFGADVLKEKTKAKAQVKKMGAAEEDETEEPAASKEKRRIDSFQVDAESPASKRPRSEEGPASLPREASPVGVPEPAPGPGSDNADGDSEEESSEEDSSDDESSDKEGSDEEGSDEEGLDEESPVKEGLDLYTLSLEDLSSAFDSIE